MKTYRKRNAMARRTAIGGRSRWYYLFRGLLLSLCLTIPVFLILSFAMAWTDFPEEYLSPAVLATVIASILFSAFFSTAGTKNSGWFNGTLVGILYMFVAVVFRWTLEGRVYCDKDILLMLIAGMLLGTVSGMVGLNLTAARSRARQKSPLRSLPIVGSGSSPRDAG